MTSDRQNEGNALKCDTVRIGDIADIDMEITINGYTPFEADLIALLGRIEKSLKEIENMMRKDC